MLTSYQTTKFSSSLLESKTCWTIFEMNCFFQLALWIHESVSLSHTCVINKAASTYFCFLDSSSIFSLSICVTQSCLSLPVSPPNSVCLSTCLSVCLSSLSSPPPPPLYLSLSLSLAFSLIATKVQNGKIYNL